MLQFTKVTKGNALDLKKTSIKFAYSDFFGPPISIWALTWNNHTGGLNRSLLHAHKHFFVLLNVPTKQRGEKGPYLPESPLHKEQEINSTFFSSFTASFTFFYPQPWSPHCKVGQRPEGWRRGKCRGGGWRKGGSAEGVEAHLIRGWMMQVSVAWGGEKINDELLLQRATVILHYRLNFHFTNTVEEISLGFMLASKNITAAQKPD